MEISGFGEVKSGNWGDLRVPPFLSSIIHRRFLFFIRSKVVCDSSISHPPFLSIGISNFQSTAVSSNRHFKLLIVVYSCINHRQNGFDEFE
ncbi:hypothetical protein HanIR_Chr09g0395311 [Helianthus annuus]|nr:hypothetical protein HanIR_Chr09g0395311 [Helianthus annuus]